MKMIVGMGMHPVESLVLVKEQTMNGLVDVY